MIHVWREILKRNLSPRDICRVAQTCKLLHRLCAEQNVWEPFGPLLEKIACGHLWTTAEMMPWLFPFATDVHYVCDSCHVVEIHFNVTDWQYRFKRKEHQPLYLMSILIIPTGLVSGYPGAVRFNVKDFRRAAIKERCTPLWVWENNPLVKHAVKLGALLKK
jgi:hypothetical protein